MPEGHCPVSYLILWRLDAGCSDDVEGGGKWVPLTKLVEFMDVIEKYEIENFDGPKFIEQEFRDAPVDDMIEPDQIWMNPEDIKKRKEDIKK